MNYPDASVVDDQKEKESDWLLNKHLLNENVLNLYLLSPLWDSGYHITTLLINKAVQNEPRITWVVEWIIFLVKRAGKITVLYWPQMRWKEHVLGKGWSMPWTDSEQKG